jgi:hypothetical protein
MLVYQDGVIDRITQDMKIITGWSYRQDYAGHEDSAEIITCIVVPREWGMHADIQEFVVVLREGRSFISCLEQMLPSGKFAYFSGLIPILHPCFV